jgi:hypothetical protein
VILLKPGPPLTAMQHRFDNSYLLPSPDLGPIGRASRRFLALGGRASAARAGCDGPENSNLDRLENLSHGT